MVAQWPRRLAIRLLFFLSVALVPIGLVAVLQTGDIVAQAESRADAALVSLTRDAAFAEREIIQRAAGKAVGLSALARQTWGDTAACSAALAEFVTEQETAVTVGVIRPDGDMWCSSTGERYDFSGFPGWEDAVAAQAASVGVNPRAPISRRPVVIVSQPLFRAGEFSGFVFLSIPHEALAVDDALSQSQDLAQDLAVVTFTSDGTVLTVSGTQPEEVDAILPSARPLDALTGAGSQTFRAVAGDGETRGYAVLPIVDGTVYALGSWVPVPIGSTAPVAINPQFFPLIMWLTSLFVVFATVYRLVIRHIAKLRRQMRAFARNRYLPRSLSGSEVSAELVELQDAFVSMAETLLHDEAELEQLVHDKNVLLKEVHHRVKNNLQLISSIMNMQMRQLKSPEARGAVQRLQERVLGLASIHRTLYRTENLSQVQTAPMLTELTDQILAMGQGGIRLERHFDDIPLYPDQAVPLSLLVAEATTNALKHTRAQAGTWLSVSLRGGPDQQITAEISNSRAPDAGDAGLETDGTAGLGTNLMRAFALQLGGTLEMKAGADRFSVRIDFLRQGFDPEDALVGAAA